MSARKRKGSPRAGALDILAFGEVLWDIFQVGPHDFRRVIGGAPANVAVQMARLGGRAAVVGAVGRDSFGTDLLGLIDAEGVDTSAVARRPERTGIAFVLRSTDGQPRFLFYRQATADMAHRIVDLPRTFPAAKYALIGSSTFVRDTLADTTRAFAKRARAAGARIICDLNVRKHLWKNVATIRRAVSDLVQDASVIKASAEDLVHLEVGSESAALAWLKKRAPRAMVLLTRGAAGSSAFVGKRRVDCPVRRVRPLDATGAGDGFLAGCVRVFGGLPEAQRDDPSDAALRWALRVGNEVGTRVVSGLGAVAADTRPLAKLADRALREL